MSPQGGHSTLRCASGRAGAGAGARGSWPFPKTPVLFGQPLPSCPGGEVPSKFSLPKTGSGDGSEPAGGRGTQGSCCAGQRTWSEKQLCPSEIGWPVSRDEPGHKLQRLEQQMEETLEGAGLHRCTPAAHVTYIQPTPVILSGKPVEPGGPPRGPCTGTLPHPRWSIPISDSRRKGSSQAATSLGQALPQ